MIPGSMVGSPGSPRNLTLNRGGMAHRGLPRRNIPTNSGGRLEIAGVVVGSWGPNYGLATPIGVSRSVMVQPQVGLVNYFQKILLKQLRFKCII